MGNFTLLSIWLLLGQPIDAALSQDLCAQALRGPFAEAARVAGSLRVCRGVAAEAGRQGVAVDVAVAVAFHESRFRDLPSYTGRRLLAAGTHTPATLPGWVERSAMQCKPKWHCPKTGPCDHLAACVRHLKRQLAQPRVCKYVRRDGREGFSARCTPGGGVRVALDRYHAPYGHAGGYGYRVLARLHRLRGAQEVASNSQAPARLFAGWL